MIVGYLLLQLAKAVKYGDLAMQTRVAEALLPYEQIGKVSNKDVIDAIEGFVYV